MATHVFANIVITYLTLPSAVRSLLHPTASSVLPDDEDGPPTLYLSWVYAIHIYHPLFYKTGRMDWIHHVPVYILNTLMFSVRAGDVILLQACVMTGIPGGIDYALQVLEGSGRMSRGAYKEWCALINNWIRAPFGALSSYICLLGLWHDWAAASTWQRLVLTLMGVHAYWNPPFFSRQALEANVVDVINRFTLVAGTIKLPNVRSLAGKEPRASKRVEAYPVDQAAPIDAPNTTTKSDDVLKKGL